MIRYFCMGKGDEIDAVRWRTLGTYFKIKLLCRNSTVLIQIPFYWRTLHLPEKKISVPILVQVVVPFPLSGAAGICQDIFMQ